MVQLVGQEGYACASTVNLVFKIEHLLAIHIAEEELVATVNHIERACKHENIQPGRVGLGMHMAIYGHAGNAIWFTSHIWKHIFATNWFGN